MDGRLRVLVMIAGVLMMHAPARASALPKPTHTNKTKFRIPFKFDSTALQRMNAREVQLHVSRDHGATWQLAQILEPDGGKFEYQSPSEGEYWFAVKTLDGRSQLHPPRGSYETGLIVVVDNTSPILDLSLQQAGAGKVQLNWQATDSNLDLNTLRLDCLAPGSSDWEPIDVVPQTSGEKSWAVRQNGIVAVRGSIADTAGNVVHAKAQINTDASNERGLKLRPTHRGPIAGITLEDDSTSTDSKGFSSASASTIPDPGAGEQGYRGPVITPQGGSPVYSRPIEQYAPTASKSHPEFHRDYLPASTGSTGQVPVTTAVMGSTQENSPQPQFASRPSQVFDASPPTRRVSSLQRVVTSRRFQVGYKLEDVGPSGIAAVELFITEDNGRKWWKYGDDPDQKSPFDVEVPRDGEFGFAIRVRSGAGLSNDPPAPGELPAIAIAVDQTAPIVELLPIQQGQGANINRLLIRWRITEDLPSDKPVSLYYAANRNGPWEPISGWKEDRNGAFEWTVGLGVPVQFYIRIMVRDAAGNVAKAETSQPIIVDRSRPTAQIIDVEAPAESGPQ